MFLASKIKTRRSARIFVFLKIENLKSFVFANSRKCFQLCFLIKKIFSIKINQSRN